MLAAETYQRGAHYVSAWNEASRVRMCHDVGMSSINALAETAALIGEPARTAMLVTLMDERALTAGELARAAGVMPATASGHLARLVEGGLLAVTAQGRHRYYRLASPDVARLIENMMGVAGVTAAARACRPVYTGPADLAMRHARRCYDHLAGEVAVAIADVMAQEGHLEWSAETAAMTDGGIAFLARLGVDTGKLVDRGVTCRPCMDWSERRPHLAGAVGRALLQTFLARNWVRATPGSRAIAVTPTGKTALAQHFGIR